jgi:predicted PurR-regulated permease PerM
MGATVFGLYLCYRLAAPFVPALVWASALAVLFAPLQGWLESKLRWPSLAAAVCVLIIAVIVVAPVTIVAERLVVQAAKGAQLVERKVASGEWQRSFSAQPRMGKLADRIARRIDLADAVKSATDRLGASAGKIAKGSLLQAAGVVLTFYLLFFFLRDRQLVLRGVKYFSPLSDPQTDRLLKRVHDTVYATIYGTLAVSCVQGLLGGLMFWWLGLSAPLLWGVVMAMMGVVPVLGTFVVWVPAAIFLALEGHWGSALILALWGLMVVSTVDNLLRPILVGNRLKLHTVLAFLSIVGGLLLFGAAGFILGPVILTVTMVLLESWTSRGRSGVDVSQASSGPGSAS